jgi:hypothetical protein
MEGGKGEGSAAALSEQVGRRFFDEITVGEVDAGGLYLPEDLLGSTNSAMVFIPSLSARPAMLAIVRVRYER